MGGFYPIAFLKEKKNKRFTYFPIEIPPDGSHSDEQSSLTNNCPIYVRTIYSCICVVHLQTSHPVYTQLIGRMRTRNSRLDVISPPNRLQHR